MQLPSPVRTYFDAEQHNNADTLAAAFMDDAVVRDEGAEHVGPAAIRDWWQAAKTKYRHVAEPIDATTADERTIVRARVTGEFPGSPATLKFSFVLADDRIARLEIG